MITKKQLRKFAVSLINEASKSHKNVSVDFKKDRINIWFYCNTIPLENIDIHSFLTLRENKQSFKNAILKMREKDE